jgi:hypothetical protein
MQHLGTEGLHSCHHVILQDPSPPFHRMQNHPSDLVEISKKMRVYKRLSLYFEGLELSIPPGKRFKQHICVPSIMLMSITEVCGMSHLQLSLQVVLVLMYDE